MPPPNVDEIVHEPIEPVTNEGLRVSVLIVSTAPFIVNVSPATLVSSSRYLFAVKVAMSHLHIHFSNEEIMEYTYVH